MEAVGVVYLKPVHKTNLKYSGFGPILASASISTDFIFQVTDITFGSRQKIESVEKGTREKSVHVIIKIQ